MGSMRLHLLMIFGLAVAPGSTAFAESMSREVLLELRDEAASPDGRQTTSAAEITILNQRRVPGSPARERNPELSQNHLYVVALRKDGSEIAQVIVLDPRIIRAEIADPTGALTSQTFIREVAAFPLVLPDDSAFAALEIYKPQWTGTDWLLVRIGTADVP